MNNFCLAPMDFYVASHGTIFFGILSVFFAVTIAVIMYVAIQFKINGLEKLVAIFLIALTFTGLFTLSYNEQDKIKGEKMYAQFITKALILEDVEKAYISDFTFTEDSIRTSVQVDPLKHIIKNKAVFHETGLYRGEALLYGTTSLKIEGSFVIAPIKGYKGHAYMEYVDLKAGNPYGLPQGFYNKVIYIPQ